MNQLCNDILARYFETTSRLGWSQKRPGTFECSQELVERLGRDVEGLVLFGSRARGQETSGSDTDLLIVLAEHRRITRNLYQEWDRLFPSKEDELLSPHFVSLPSDLSDVGSIWYEVALHGKILWEKELHVTEVLAGLREQFLTRQIQRRWVHGHPYWVKGGT